ncbi:MAG: MOFRL family protein, partial [Pyrinomonadaceae bacterium]
TNTGEETNVASGPTLAPTANAPAAAEIISRYEMASGLPASILRAVEKFRVENFGPSDSDAHRHYVLLDNEHALEAAAKAARSFGFTVEVAHDLVEQPVDEGCATLLDRLFALSRSASGNERRAACLISGGEFVCPVRGAGVGGRNGETVLRCALEIEERKKIDERIAGSNVVVLSAGTDGIDGNSPAAGALADEETIKRALALGLDAKTFLEDSDAYSFFKSLDETIITGPTGTNVRDVRIMLSF